jgi:hypothetical protein
VWQDVLICAEMLAFSIAHAYAFPSKEYRLTEDDGHDHTFREQIRQLFNFHDVYEQGTTISSPFNSNMFQGTLRNIEEH